MSRIQISPHRQLSLILKIILYFEALGSRSSLIELLIIIMSYGLTTIGSSSPNAAQLHSIERHPGVRHGNNIRALYSVNNDPRVRLRNVLASQLLSRILQ